MAPRTAARRLLPLVLLGALLAACGGEQPAADPAPDPAPPPAAEDSPEVTGPARSVDPTTPDAEVAQVPAGLDFVLDDLNGGQVVGAELAGRDLVLWFWAPW